MHSFCREVSYLENLLPKLEPSSPNSAFSFPLIYGLMKRSGIEVLKASESVFFLEQHYVRVSRI